MHIITSFGDGGAEGVRFRLCPTDEETVHEAISLQGPSKFGPLPTERGRLSPSLMLRLCRTIRAAEPDVLQTELRADSILICRKPYPGPTRLLDLDNNTLQAADLEGAMAPLCAETSARVHRLARKLTRRLMALEPPFTLYVRRMRADAEPLAPLPLVIDLDGTLLRSDMLAETLLDALRGQPRSALAGIRALGRGKAAAKAKLADAATINPADLPYDAAVLGLIDEARRAHRQVVLATAADAKVAASVAQHLGIFDLVLASDGHVNLAGERKCQALVERFGERGFDYAVNARDDLPVLAVARRGYLVRPTSRVERAAQRVNPSTSTLVPREPPVADWVRAIRVHQWAKNLLLFLPMLAAHTLDVTLALTVLVGFLVFSLTASGVYLINDLLDLPFDRRHPEKRHRPLAAGRLPLVQAALAALLLLVSSFSLSALLLPAPFLGILGVYFSAALAYSLALKRTPMVDVLTLALLYTLRLIAGAAAIGLPLTAWMLAFSLFTFLSIALVKRYAEIHQLTLDPTPSSTPGRGYHTSDLGLIQNLGTAAGYLSALILALYIQDDATAALYRRSELIWFAIPLWLHWIMRVWMLSHRGQMHQDPVLFAISDRTSYLTVALLALVFLAAR